jgi:hypothetical protein
MILILFEVADEFVPLRQRPVGGRRQDCRTDRWMPYHSAPSPVRQETAHESFVKNYGRAQAMLSRETFATIRNASAAMFQPQKR